MDTDFSAQTIGAFLVGLLVGASAAWLLLPSSDNHHENHPIADPYDSEYHVHTDFHIYLNSERIDLARPELMTTSEQQLHEDVHLHDDNGEVVHIHAETITFAEFLDSVGIGLTQECLSYEGTDYCTNDSDQLALYVNGENYRDPVTEYIPLDDDSVLLYYGTNDPDPEMIQSFLDGIPNDSCYYSGTCPERGIAPSESCGLTCEL